MRWSWHVGTYRGIGVYLHATFLLLLGWIFLAHLLRGQGVLAAVGGALFLVLLFLCVVLHEFGHALMAQRYGVGTRDITLYPIGGVARLERIPREPRQELAIALAGPAVNVVIAALLFAYLALANALTAVEGLQLVGGDMLNKLMWANVILVGFNMLPAFPMDGGRVLRAVLAQRQEYGRATQTAASIGQGMAMLFGLSGLLAQQPLWLFAAFFVYLGASQEAAMVQTELAFRGVPTRGAMMTRFGTLVPEQTLADAADLLLAGPQHDFPVLENGAVVGILTREGLVKALSESGPAHRIAEAMRPAPAAVDPSASLETTFQQMREADAQSVPVVEGGRLVGLITLENIAEFLMVRSAVEQLSARSGRTGLDDSAAEGETRSRRPYWMPGRGRARG